MTLAAGRPREGGINLTLDELEHLLIDAGRDGWLNGEVIETALRLHARDVPAYVMPAARWTCTFWEDFKGAIYHRCRRKPRISTFLCTWEERTGAWHISTQPICECISSTLWKACT